MSFTEHQEHLIEINPPFYVLTVQQSDIIKKSGEEVGRQFTRLAYHPGDDLSEAPQDVQTVANALWTSQVIYDYQQSLIVPSPYDDVVTTAVIADSTAVFADGAPATSDPNGVETGWLYQNQGNGEKINWYLFGQDPQDPNATTYTLGDIESLYLKLSQYNTSTTRLPFISIYTLPLGDGQDAESWYRSRVTYDLNNPAPELFAGGDAFVTYLRSLPLVNRDLLSEELQLNQVYSAGPQASDERLLMIAVSTDSSAAAGEYNFTLDEFAVITSDERRTLVNTLAAEPAQ